MAIDKRIHFGDFVYWGRVNLGLNRRGFTREMARYLKGGFTERQLIRIEKEPIPSSQAITLLAIAKILGFSTVEDFNAAWRSTPVSEPEKESAEAKRGRRGRAFSGFLLKMAQADQYEINAAIKSLTPEIRRTLVPWARGILGDEAATAQAASPGVRELGVTVAHHPAPEKGHQ